MKVLFAVSTEDIAEKIIKVYQTEYKEIISSKNVYYFNAIIKELQRNQTYDRIVISEDLEPFTNNNYDTIDKFIFEKLDGISDEAIDREGRDIPIVVICSERREKSDNLLVKLFSIGVYDALVGNDRTIENVCNLLNKPRTKKEAKIYYKIDQGEYEREDEKNVSEVEIQNILAHYRKLGKNESRYVESFNSIAEQYNDDQLKVIIKFLPMEVKAVLEAESPKYQSIMTYTGGTVPKKQAIKKNNIKVSEIVDSHSRQPTGPVIIPSAMRKSNEVRKIVQSEPQLIPQPEIVGNDTNEILEEIESIEGVAPIEPIETIASIKSTAPIKASIELEVEGVNQQEQPVKRGRGRPKKITIEPEVKVEPPKRGRGRPRKNPLPETEVQKEITQEVEQVPSFEPLTDIASSTTIPGFEEEIAPTLPSFEEEIAPTLPSFEEEVAPTLPSFEEEVAPTLPSFEEEEVPPTLPNFEETPSVAPTFQGKRQPRVPSFKARKDIAGRNLEEQINPTLSNFEKSTASTLPGFDDIATSTLSGFDEPVNPTLPDFREQFNTMDNIEKKSMVNNNIYRDNNYASSSVKDLQEVEDEGKQVDISYLLTQDKKIVSFVGTSKNGVSFLINNIADILSNGGIKTAIVDLTKNKNSYYIYTENREELREIAYSSMENLKRGNPIGIEVNRNLTIYTSSPNIKNSGNNIEDILTTLVKNYSLVLLDCDYSTNKEYFRVAQEIYMVQSMDVLTIQPLTEFLRKLKLNNILQPEKLKAVINKAQKIRGLNEEMIVGGMSTYNDPEMSIQDRLFDMKTISKNIIPFDMEAYSIYLSGIANCEISTKGYNKAFMNYLNRLADQVYPVISGGALKKKRKENTNNANYSNYGQNGTRFSNDMSSTLSQMKRQYK